MCKHFFLAGMGITVLTKSGVSKSRATGCQESTPLRCCLTVVGIQCGTWFVSQFGRLEF
jgi:hypothetical protein